MECLYVLVLQSALFLIGCTECLFLTECTYWQYTVPPCYVLAAWSALWVLYVQSASRFGRTECLVFTDGPCGVHFWVIQRVFL